MRGSKEMRKIDREKNKINTERPGDIGEQGDLIYKGSRRKGKK